jgi:hypothetical protein
MSNPFVQIFDIGGLQVSSVVIDQQEFNVLCDELEGIKHLVPKSGDLTSPFSKADIDRIRAAKHIPMMSRGFWTVSFFDRWGVTTDKLCVIVRGHGRTLAGKLGFDYVPENN